MANVYLAWDKLRTTEVAVKVLHSELSSESRFLNMFKKETEFMRELPHPNIVRLYDCGVEKRETEKVVFIVMDYKKGCDLRRFLARRGRPLSTDEVSQVLAAVCKALYFAHQSNVLHCDVKSANILLSHDEKTALMEKDVFLSDFGISRWAIEQEGGGTPAYMAPELFQGGVVNEKTEIYAMGVTLYEMLSGGQLPYQGDTNSPGSTARERIAWEIQYKPLPPLQQLNPALSNEIVSIVDKAMNKDAMLRHTTILDIWYDFDNIQPQQDSVVMSSKKTVILPPPPHPTTPNNQVISYQPARHTNQPHIYGISGEKAGQEFAIFQQGLTIGRAKNNQLRLMDRTVSRVHAKIIKTRRAFYIQDEESTLGTYINGLRIPPNKPILINDGDRIEFANSQIFEFRLK